MLLSVVTATYKRVDLLKKNFIFLKKNQNLFNFEWIIVCEKNDVKTVNFLNKIKSEKFIKIIKGRFKSADKAYIEGFKIASGKYLNIHGDDDFFCKKNFKKIRNYLILNKEWVIGKAEYLDSNFNKIRISTTLIKSFFLSCFNKNILSVINFVMTPSIFFKKNLLKRVGGYDPNILYGSDYILWLKFNKFFKPFIVKETLSYIVFNAHTKTGTFDLKRYLVFFNEMKKFSSNIVIRFFQILSLLTIIIINFFLKKILRAY